MIRPIVKDVFFLGRKSEPATQEDQPDRIRLVFMR